MDDDDRDLLDSLSAPLGDVIAQVGANLAAAQQALDEQAILNFQLLYGETGERFAALREIGYRPTFYHIPECNVDVQIALTLNGRRQESGRPAGVRLYAAPLDAGYTNAFAFSLQASSKLSFRIVPVPPPAALDRLVAVPALVDLAVADARARLETLGLVLATDPAEAPDAAIVRGQDPEPGGMVEEGSTVTIAIDE